MVKSRALTVGDIFQSADNLFSDKERHFVLRIIDEYWPTTFGSEDSRKVFTVVRLYSFKEEGMLRVQDQADDKVSVPKQGFLGYDVGAPPWCRPLSLTKESSGVFCL